MWRNELNRKLPAYMPDHSRYGYGYPAKPKLRPAVLTPPDQLVIPPDHPITPPGRPAGPSNLNVASSPKPFGLCVGSSGYFGSFDSLAPAAPHVESRSTVSIDSLTTPNPIHPPLGSGRTPYHHHPARSTTDSAAVRSLANNVCGLHPQSPNVGTSYRDSMHRLSDPPVRPPLRTDEGRFGASQPAGIIACNHATTSVPIARKVTSLADPRAFAICGMRDDAANIVPTIRRDLEGEPDFKDHMLNYPTLQNAAAHDCQTHGESCRLLRDTSDRGTHPLSSPDLGSWKPHGAESCNKQPTRWSSSPTVSVPTGYGAPTDAGSSILRKDSAGAPAMSADGRTSTTIGVHEINRLTSTGNHTPFPDHPHPFPLPLISHPPAPWFDCHRPLMTPPIGSRPPQPWAPASSPTATAPSNPGWPLPFFPRGLDGPYGFPDRHPLPPRPRRKRRKRRGVPPGAPTTAPPREGPRPPPAPPSPHPSAAVAADPAAGSEAVLAADPAAGSEAAPDADPAAGSDAAPLTPAVVAASDREGDGNAPGKRKRDSDRDCDDDDDGAGGGRVGGKGKRTKRVADGGRASEDSACDGDGEGDGGAERSVMLGRDGSGGATVAEDGYGLEDDDWTGILEVCELEMDAAGVGSEWPV